MIDRATIDRIMEASEITDIVGDFVELKRKGVNYTACCPFHNEKTPSFIVSPAKGIYKCFGCGKAGNTVNFVMEHEKLSYPEALKWLAKKYGIEVAEKELTEEQKKQNDDKESMMIVTAWAAEYFKGQLSTTTGANIAKSYFYERGFTDETIDKFGLGYCPSGGEMTKTALKEGYKEKFLISAGVSARSEQNNDLYDRFRERVMFPIQSISGRVIGFGGRTMRTDKKLAKYVNSPQSEIYDKSKTLYGIAQAKKAIVANSKCILVEGYTDVIQMHQSGIENVVASSGTSLTVDQVKLIKRFTKTVTVIYDGDSAGIKASLRGIDIILKEGLNVRVVPLPEQDDPDSFARRHNSIQIEEYIAANEEDFISFKTKILLDNHTLNDPIKKGEVVSDIIRSIAVIPDAIQRSIYISECSKTLDIDKEILQNEVRMKVVTSIDGEQGRAVEQNRIKRERQQAGSRGGANDADYQQEHGFNPEDYGHKGVPSIEHQLDDMEREIIELLLQFGDKSFDVITDDQEPVSLTVEEAIIEDLKDDNITFLNPLYLEIYQLCLDFYEKEKPITSNFFINHPNPQISNFAVNTLTKEERHKLSPLWEKQEIMGDSESQMLAILIPKILSIFKSKIIEKDISDLEKQQLTASDFDAEQDILRSIMEKSQIRRELLDQYQRLF